MDSTAESGGRAVRGYKNTAKWSRYWPRWRSYQGLRRQLTRREAVAALLVRARTDRTGKREKKKTEAKKKLPRIVDSQDNEA